MLRQKYSPVPEEQFWLYPPEREQATSAGNSTVTVGVSPILAYPRCIWPRPKAESVVRHIWPHGELACKYAARLPRQHRKCSAIWPRTPLEVASRLQQEQPATSHGKRSPSASTVGLTGIPPPAPATQAQVLCKSIKSRRVYDPRGVSGDRRTLLSWRYLWGRRRRTPTDRGATPLGVAIR